MIEIVSKITQFFPKLAVLTNFTLIIFLILQISDDFGKIMNFLNKVFDFRKHVDTLFYAKKRKKYNEVLYSSDFLNWQTKVMEIIYAPLIDEVNDEFEKSDQTSIGFTNIFFDNSTEEPVKYESITLKMKPVEFPFGGICSKKNLERKKDISQEKYKEIQKKYKWMVRKYYRLIGQTIRYPKRMGYMLDDLVFVNENEDWYVTAYCGNYENNLKTSHILEYELYELYKKIKDINGKLRPRIETRY